LTARQLPEESKEVLDSIPAKKRKGKRTTKRFSHPRGRPGGEEDVGSMALQRRHRKTKDKRRGSEKKLEGRRDEGVSMFCKREKEKGGQFNEVAWHEVQEEKEALSKTSVFGGAYSI